MFLYDALMTVLGNVCAEIKIVYALNNVETKVEDLANKIDFINVKRLPLETKNTLWIRKWESRFY